jgi:hypothetical protein
MKKIDYSKWYGSHVCPFCVTKHEKDNIRTEEVRIPRDFGYFSKWSGSHKVKIPYCKECHNVFTIFLKSCTNCVLLYCWCNSYERLSFRPGLYFGA